MTTQWDDLARRLLGDLRVARSPWHVRGERQGVAVVDTRDAVLVWEPRRVTPVYAVPREALHGAIGSPRDPRTLSDREARRPVLDPSVPFAAHTAPGAVLELEAAGGTVELFAVEDALLDDRLLVDFAALDWFEEDEPVTAHPRDPFHRIDVRPTGRHLVLTSGGVPVVDTTRARMLQETGLPMRWYVPREDVLVPLEASGTTTACAYKGRATYVSARIGDRLERDLAWIYDSPLADGRDVQGLLGFFTERLDVTIDGVPVPHPGRAEPSR